MTLSLQNIRDTYADGVKVLSKADFIAPLLLRLYLAPIFWMAGWNKFANFGDTVEWFGNSEWGLGLPLPSLLAGLATGTELVGAILLVTGLAIRLISIPLLFTMFVAMFTVHWPNGWLAIAEGEGFFASMRSMEAVERLAQAKAILREHGDYEYLTEHGSFVMLNNGIEFGATYSLMLLSLLFTGAGRWLSLDWWIDRGANPEPASRAFRTAYQ
ncbi:MAG: HvfX family Cu-binding RiPP maturation protein [Panacagrimonas sp.]